MSSREELIARARLELVDVSPVDYDFDDADMARFINKALAEIYPALYRNVVSDEIRLRYDEFTYDLSTLSPPVEGLIGIWIVASTGEYFLNRHYVYEPTGKLLTLLPGWSRVVLRSSATSDQTGERLYVQYRSYFTRLDDDYQECELDAPDEELIFSILPAYALEQMRFNLLRGRARLPTETWNELDRIITRQRGNFSDLLNRKRMVRHGGLLPSTRRKIQTRRMR